MSLVNAPGYFAFQRIPELNFLVAHEFGHALGLIHEHQRMDCTQYLADKAVVMAVYRFNNDSDYQSFIANLTQIPASDPALRPMGLAPRRRRRRWAPRHRRALCTGRQERHSKMLMPGM